MTRRIAICVGINDYPGSGNDLHGCVNDATDWAALLTTEGYQTTTLLDAAATRNGVLSALRTAVGSLRFGDRLVFTYSGHGSYVPDTNGDEPDGRDECLVTHDWQAAGYITDDELGATFDARRWGSRVVVVSDSCHSGTVSRFIGPVLVPRYFPTERLQPRPAVQRRAVRVQSESVLFSGCGDTEYSYDALIDGRPRGAFTAAALAAYRHGQSFKAWHQGIALPTAQYPQTPELHATAWQRRWTL